MDLMSVSLHVRDVPDEIHESLVRRAEQRGMSLRQYTLAVLEEHCRLPTFDEWLDELQQLKPAEGTMSAVEALAEARDEDDLAVLGVRSGR